MARMVNTPTLELDAQVRASVEVDRATVRQAVINIIDNAIKYSPRGSRVETRVGTTKQDEANVRAAAKGSGIPLEHRERVFERFDRIDKGRSSQTGGSGLGLAIAQWALEADSGKIELETEQDKGSIFRIVLPNRGESK